MRPSPAATSCLLKTPKTLPRLVLGLHKPPPPPPNGTMHHPLCPRPPAYLLLPAVARPPKNATPPHLAPVSFFVNNVV